MAVIPPTEENKQQAEHLLDMIFNKPGHWVDTYNPNIHGSLDDWCEMRRQKKAHKQALIDTSLYLSPYLDYQNEEYYSHCENDISNIIKESSSFGYM